MIRQITRENCGPEICGFLAWRKFANWFALTLVSTAVEYTDEKMYSIGTGRVQRFGGFGEIGAPRKDVSLKKWRRAS
jgi:hypothetical protein